MLRVPHWKTFLWKALSTAKRLPKWSRVSGRRRRPRNKLTCVGAVPLFSPSFFDTHPGHRAGGIRECACRRWRERSRSPFPYPLALLRASGVLHRVARHATWRARHGWRKKRKIGLRSAGKSPGWQLLSTCARKRDAAARRHVTWAHLFPPSAPPPFEEEAKSAAAAAVGLLPACRHPSRVWPPLLHGGRRTTAKL